MPRFSFGALLVPDDWTVQLQIELREPARALASGASALPTLAPTKPAPATNIIVRRGESATSPAGAARALVDELRTSTTSLNAAAPVDVVFEDGAPGVELQLSFRTPELAALTIVQRHLFRADAGVVTHLCATAPDARALVPLGPVLLSFTPA